MVHRALITILLSAVLAQGAFAQKPEFDLKPLETGSEIKIPASVQMNFPNDKATLFFLVEVENTELSFVQSEVNRQMELGQKAIQDFSSIAKVETTGYSVTPLWTQATEKQASKIAGWKARQILKVTTEDVQGVASLVQVAQNSGLALGDVQFGLTEEARELADNQLIEASLQVLNRRVGVATTAMGLSSDIVRIKKLNFEGGFANNIYSPRLSAYAMSAKTVATPSFSVGETQLSMTVNAVITIEDPTTEKDIQ